MKLINSKLLDFKNVNTDESQLLMAEEISSILSSIGDDQEFDKTLSIVLSRLFTEAKIISAVSIVDKHIL